NMQLLRENSKLKSHISDLKREIGLIYKSTKEFLKARTNDLKTFKSLFNDLVGKIKEKAPEGEFERLNRVEKRRERENGLER
ncbi:plasmid recombination protein, partial [Bacillus subtilis]